MMNRIYDFFDSVGEFITSMALVLLLLIPFMWYRFFEFKTLFIEWLPIEALDEKALASRLISLVFICITVAFMVNVKRLFKGIKLILAATAFVINFFFWSLNPNHNVYFVVFISLVIASMDYGLPHLFDQMWKERGKQSDFEDLSKVFDEKQEQLKKLDARISVLTPKVKEYEKVLKESTCPHCEKIFSSWQAVNSHKNSCSQNHNKK